VNAAAFLIGWSISLVLVFSISYAVGGTHTAQQGGGHTALEIVEILLGIGLILAASRQWRRRNQPRTSSGVSRNLAARLQKLNPWQAAIVGVLKQPWALTAAAAVVVIRDHGRFDLLVFRPTSRRSPSAPGGAQGSGRACRPDYRCRRVPARSALPCRRWGQGPRTFVRSGFDEKLSPWTRTRAWAFTADLGRGASICAKERVEQPRLAPRDLGVLARAKATRGGWRVEILPFTCSLRSRRRIRTNGKRQLNLRFDPRLPEPVLLSAGTRLRLR
jgi:hypothetical protein